MDAYSKAINTMVQKVYYSHLIGLAFDSSADMAVSSSAYDALHGILESMKSKEDRSSLFRYLNKMLNQAENAPEDIHLPEFSEIPPGSPIGCDHQDYFNH
jgi:hypothetical protein